MTNIINIKKVALTVIAMAVVVFGGAFITAPKAEACCGTSYSQSSYYTQGSYHTYSQSSYYNQSSYYTQGSYYAQGSYYSQSSYYNQSSYYTQGTYNTYSQGSYYGQSSYYTQGTYNTYSQSSYYAQSSYYTQGTYNTYSQSSYYAQSTYNTYSQGSYNTYSQGSYGGGSSSPKCELEISAKKIKKGKEVTLSWETTRATEVVLKDSNGKTLIDTDDLSTKDKKEFYDGKITVRPTKDTTYTLTASKGSKDKTCKVSVDVESEVVVLETRDQKPTVAGIRLTQVPYTGFDAGPTLTFIFYALLTLWALFVAYVLVVKKKVS